MEPEIYASRMLLHTALWRSQQFRSNAIGIPIPQLDQREPNTQIRTRKLWMPGGKVSVPTHQTIEQVKEEWQQNWSALPW